jgi:hypothetical protein
LRDWIKTYSEEAAEFAAAQERRAASAREEAIKREAAELVSVKEREAAKAAIEGVVKNMKRELFSDATIARALNIPIEEVEAVQL